MRLDLNKSMKLRFSIPALSLAFFGIAHSGEITVYSHRHYESDQALFEKFTEASGIEVNVVKANADELIERLVAEGENSPADVFIAADAGRLERAKGKGVLQPVSSDQLAGRIPEQYRDPENHWFGFTMRARIIAYAPDRVSPEELTTYEALAGKDYRGRILARSSSNIYNQSLLASLIAAHGREEALEWARAVRGNMARPPQGSDRDQMRAVVAGLGDFAVVNTYYVGLLATSASEKDREVAESIGVFFPNQDGRGTHVNVSGGGITRASKNVAAATRFLEFLASDEAQKSFPETTSEYPVVDGIEWTPLLRSWGEFKADSLNLSTLGENNETAVEVFNEAGWE